MAPDPPTKTAEPIDKVTGFFSLPRELRDSIYDLIREDDYWIMIDLIFDWRAAIPEKRLVSRQFKSQYDKRSAINTVVQIIDVFALCQVRDIPRLAMKSCCLELIWTSEIDYDMSSPFDAIEPFNGGPFEPSLEDRLKSLQHLVDYLPELKDVHIELGQLETHNLKDMGMNSSRARF